MQGPPLSGLSLAFESAIGDNNGATVERKHGLKLFHEGLERGWLLFGFDRMHLFINRMRTALKCYGCANEKVSLVWMLATMSMAIVW